VRAMDFSVFIDGIETRQPGVWRLQIGAVRPLHANTTGHLMLACLEDTAIESYLKRHDGDDEGIDPAALWADIELIRQRNYATSLRHDALPMLSYSFPVWDAANQLHGVVSVGGPNERFGPLAPTLLPRLLSIMAALCQRSRLYSANMADSEITL
jgi:DNA-binding IclR family transcriptional regulator